MMQVPMQLPTEYEKSWAIHTDEHPISIDSILQSNDIIEYFIKKGQPVYYFQDPISGPIYFDVCNICEECQLAELLGCEAKDLVGSSKRSKPKHVENRPCKKDFQPQNPYAEDKEFTSLRSKFDGFQIPTSWVSKPKFSN